MKKIYNKNIERSFDSNYSIEIAKEFFKDLEKNYNIKLKIKEYDTNSEFKIFSAYLYKNDKFITEGHGKGFGIQGLASALFELSEHFFDEIIWYHELNKKNFDKKIKFIKLKDFFSQKLIKKDFMHNNSIINLHEIDQNLMIPVTTIKNLFNNESILYPFFLLSINYPSSLVFDILNDESIDIYYKDCNYFFKKDPNNDYSIFYNSLKYSSTTGGSTGLNLNDAILHGILEVIERDAISLFALESFYNNNKEKFEIIPFDFLNEKNKELFNEIKDNFGDLIILDITTDLEVPVIHSLLLDYSFGFPITGQGCSLDIDYAIERSLLELKQSIYVTPKHQVNTIINNLKTYAKEHNIKFHTIAYSYNPSIFRNNNLIKKNKYNNYKLTKKLNIKEQVEILMKILKKNNFSIYLYERLTFNDLIKCIKVIIPDMEDIGLGFNLLFPGKRGLSYLKINA